MNRLSLSAGNLHENSHQLDQGPGMYMNLRLSLPISVCPHRRALVVAIPVHSYQSRHSPDQTGPSHRDKRKRADRLVKTIYVSTANRLYAGYVSSMQLLYLLQGRARPKLQLPRSCNCFRTRSACAELGSIASALCKCNFA